MGMRKRAFLFCALAACALAVSAQSYSLRSNILGLTTTNLNLEASMTLNRKWSLHLPVQYNPFKFGSNRQFRNFYAAPERATGCWKATWTDSSACTVRPACTAWGTCSAASTATRGRLRSRFKCREGLPDRPALEPRMGGRRGCCMAGL